MNDVLKDTVGTKSPVDIKEIVNMRYSVFNGILIRSIENPDEKRQLFAEAKKITEHEYLKRYNEGLEPQYTSLGARYLLMPDNAFLGNVRRYGFNILELMRDIYTNVHIEDIAYHMVDECDCSARKFSQGKFDTPRWNDGIGSGNRSALRQIEIEVVNETLRNPAGTFSRDITWDYKITGWRDGTDTVMLIYL